MWRIRLGAMLFSSKETVMAFELTRPASPTSTAQTEGSNLSTRAAQALMLIVGIVGTFGVVYFTMVEPEDGMNAVDGLVAGLLLIGSLGYIAGWPRPASPSFVSS
jgi:hypothetical protein